MARNISDDAHRGNVRELQQYLRDISFSGAQVRRVIPDGVYGENTAGAVSDFQRMNNMPVTGETDRATWDSVYGAYSYIKSGSVQRGIMAFPSPDAVFCEGDSGTAIIILQAMLNTAAGAFVNIGANSISGVYDRDTAKSVAFLQKVMGMPSTGLTDLRTWNAVTELFNMLTQE